MKLMLLPFYTIPIFCSNQPWPYCLANGFHWNCTNVNKDKEISLVFADSDLLTNISNHNNLLKSDYYNFEYYNHHHNFFWKNILSLLGVLGVEKVGKYWTWIRINEKKSDRYFLSVRKLFLRYQNASF